MNPAWGRVLPAFFSLFMHVRELHAGNLKFTGFQALFPVKQAPVCAFRMQNNTYFKNMIQVSLFCVNCRLRLVAL